MGIPTKNTQLNEIAGLGTFYNGGKGSGNFGHSGRPGKVGGAGKGGSSSKSSGGKNHSYDSVSERTILRDYGDKEEFPYIDKEHEMLCDIADALYNAGVNSEQLKSEYKELHDRYGRDYWDKVLSDMGAIDSQLDGGSQSSHYKELVEDYKDRLKDND